VSRGPDGALLINTAEDLHLRARAPNVSAVNTVGAGDAMLAAVGREILEGAPHEQWLRWGVAAGTAAVQNPAGQLPSLRSVAALANKIRIEILQSTRGSRRQS
jgi:6-phosphofructokinase 2